METLLDTKSNKDLKLKVECHIKDYNDMSTDENVEFEKSESLWRKSKNYSISSNIDIIVFIYPSSENYETHHPIECCHPLR